jgi:hypothetical protein
MNQRIKLGRVRRNVVVEHVPLPILVLPEYGCSVEVR